MKYLKRFNENYEDDDFSGDDDFLDYEKDDEGLINISTSSNVSASETNRKAYDRLYDILMDEDKNPYFDLFNQEELSLDDTNGFIGIFDNAEEEDFDYIDMMKLNNFIREYLENNDILIIIGDYSFKKTITKKEIEDYKTSVDLDKFDI